VANSDRTQWVAHQGHYIVGMHTIRDRAGLVVLVCLAWPALASAACYQLFDKKDRLVLQSTASPVDLSKSITEEVGRLYPGHYLIMGGDGLCQEVDERSRVEVKLPAASLDRGPVRIAPDSNSIGAGKTSEASTVGTSGSSSRTGSSGSANSSSPSPCYVGPKGGRYTITKSGKRNYNGC